MGKKILFTLQVLTITAALVLGSLSGATAQGKKVIELSNLAVFTAEVVGIDKKDRVLTFRELNGSVTEMKVGEEARNFDQIEVGDQLEISARNSVDLYSEAPEDQRAGAVLERAPKGEKPSGTLLQTVDTNVTVKAVNREARAVVIELPDGANVITNADSDEAFDTLNVGDKFYARLTTSLTISVKRQ